MLGFVKVPKDALDRCTERDEPFGEWAPGRIPGVQPAKRRLGVRQPSAAPTGRQAMLELVGAPTSEPRRELDVLDAAIRGLYTRLRHYATMAEQDPAAKEKHEATLARLRALQRREAKTLVNILDRHLDWRPGEGYEAIDRADALIAKYAHLTATDSSPEDSDA